MDEVAALGEDALVDALIMEVAGLLQRLVEAGEPGCIDLRGLPLSPSCIATLEARLGRGEISAQLSAAGTSQVHETLFPGVWWVRHQDETARTIALLIEVTPFPEILRASRADMAAGLARLPLATFFARHERAGSQIHG
jgi:hydrogenase-1 operon protein HyaF